jgi:hypothetical protein
MVAPSPSRFAAAVAAHPFPRFTVPPEALAQARSALAASGLLLVGEPHGVRETPGVLYELAAALGARAVAFEWSHEEMDEPLQSFVRGGAFDFERLWSLPPSSEFFCGDGRITAGHFALLERLRREGRLDQAIAFDRLDPEPPPRDWRAQVRAREPDLASRLLSEWDRRLPLLVLAGAFHARLEAPEGETMAGYLARELPGLRPAMLRYASGRCWSRGETHAVPEEVPDAPIVLRVGRATPAIVPAPLAAA